MIFRLGKYIYNWFWICYVHRFAKQHKIKDNFLRKIFGKRCSILDDNCGNDEWANSGQDGGYFGDPSSPGKRGCSNLDENCGNDEWSNSGQDGGYFEDPGSPGKRNLGKRCSNLDDNCGNDEWANSGQDGGYFGDSSSPGKRSPLIFSPKCLLLFNPKVCQLCKENPNYRLCRDLA